MLAGRRSFLARWPLIFATKANKKESAPASLENRILSAIETFEVFDTHEHIIPESQRTSQRADFYTLASHYAMNDVVSAGLSQESLARLRDPSVPDSQKWQLFEPFWKYARFTGYGQTLRIAMRDIYGLPPSDGAAVRKLNDAIGERNRPGLYRYVLKQRARIRVAVVDDYWNADAIRPDPEFFVLAHKFDRFVLLDHAQQIRELEKLTAQSITNLGGLGQALEVNFKQCLAAGMVTVKTTLAYNRNLLFQEVREQDAAREFDQLMRTTEAVGDFHAHVVRPFRQLEDYMFHQVVQLAGAHGIPFQIHTGLHSGNGNFVANSNPTLLTNLFFLYPRMKFDLFHISYPYQGELSVLAKTFPNVFADFTWAHIVSPTATEAALHGFLEMVPANKIFGFGGDYRYPELSYGHLVIARRNIARVLSQKVAAGFCNEEEAIQIAKMLLVENPAQLFKSHAEG
jgi:hypothetical protein